MTPWVREKLYQLFNYRYNAELPTVITTSDSLEEMDAAHPFTFAGRQVMLDLCHHGSQLSWRPRKENEEIENVEMRACSVSIEYLRGENNIYQFFDKYLAKYHVQRVECRRKSG